MRKAELESEAAIHAEGTRFSRDDLISAWTTERQPDERVQDFFERFLSEHPDQVDPEITDDLIRELCVITTRDEAGQHFTQWSSYYDEMEQLGLIDIHRPVHEPSGITYSQEYWSLEVTDAGQELVEAHPELHPGASEAEQVQLQNLDVASMMDWLNAKGIEPDQDWDAGSTTWTFDDGSKIVIEGNDVTVHTP